ncbi:CoA pyrophosphatase [Leucobacter insecticola]|uniref:CoA pyrophosphatase n=1 Tax=Leucobacter insecticola TaxID=2714934 RepID=A0A6G8FHH3_9MICO|nr:CoA pyrophosphatase [Leucobacter insecticola]QIM15807.1 CoA pyrophosphatase [Leucobacter insecticola]
MSRSAEQARQELRALMQRGVTLDYTPQGFRAEQPIRQSSVLILFGALDRSLATNPSAAITVAPELDVLLIRRADTLRHHPGEIAFPGGGVEPGDRDLSMTALREAAEETDLDPSGVEVLGALPEVHIPVSNNLVTPVLGWWSLPSPVAADTSESVEVFRTPVAELLDPAARGTSVLRRGRTTFRGPAFQLAPRFGGRIVWGFTGILLSNLFTALEWAPEWDVTREFHLPG